jgi:hypothetical protein
MFAIPNGGAITLPPATGSIWNFRAISFGIGIAMSGLNPAFGGATGNWLASAATAGVNTGALIALLPGAGATPVATPTMTAPAPTPTPSPGPTPARITLRGVATGSTNAASNQLTLPLPVSVQANDLLIAEVSVRGGGGLIVTAPAGWTLVRRDNSSTSVAQGIYRRVVPSPLSEPPNYTWKFNNANDAAGGILAYVGASASVPVDASNGQGNASSTVITAPSVTVPGGDTSDLLLSLFSIANSSAVTAPAGTTARWSFHATGGGIGVAASDVQLNADGPTGNRTATAATAASNTGALVVLLP